MNVSAKTVGIIGGMGPLATHAFFGELLRASQARRDQEHLRIVVDCDPTIPDRSAFILGHGTDPKPALMRVVDRLEAAGCEVLVMPCNTAHAFANEIRRHTTTLFVDWIQSAVDAIARLQLQAVGLLATEGTIAAGFYQSALAERAIRALTPGLDDQRLVTELVYGPRGVKAGVAPSDASRHALLTIGRKLIEAGAQTIVLGCSELPLILPASDESWPCRPFDPAPTVAQLVVQSARVPLHQSAASRATVKGGGLATN